MILKNELFNDMKVSFWKIGYFDNIIKTIPSDDSYIYYTVLHYPSTYVLFIPGPKICKSNCLCVNSLYPPDKDTLYIFNRFKVSPELHARSLNNLL